MPQPLQTDTRHPAERHYSYVTAPDWAPRFESCRELPESPSQEQAPIVKLRAHLRSARRVHALEHLGSNGFLYRTDHLFHRATLPGEEEQYQAYLKVLKAAGNEPATVRTILHSAPILSALGQGRKEDNPLIGCRGLRFCLAPPGKEIFKTQLCALVRAAHDAGKLSVLRVKFPMVSGAEDFQAARSLVEEAMRCLPGGGTGLEMPKCGAVIEIPGLAYAPEHLLRYADFVWINTNGLSQRTQGVDRKSPHVGHGWEPAGPSVIRLVSAVVQAAKNAGKLVGACGELADNPTLAPLLIGLGVDELSPVVEWLPAVRLVKRRLTRENAEALAAHAMRCDSGEAILRAAKDFVRERTPELLSLVPALFNSCLPVTPPKRRLDNEAA